VKREIPKARKRKRWTLGAAYAYAGTGWQANAEGAVRLVAWATRRAAGYTIRTHEGRARLDANVRGGRYPYHAPVPLRFMTLGEVQELSKRTPGVERVPELIRTDGRKVRR